MKTKIVLAAILLLCMAGLAYPFTLYLYPYTSGTCASQIVGYSWAYKSYLYPNTGYSGTYVIEEIENNQVLIKAILENWKCNRYPAGENSQYDDTELGKNMTFMPMEGIDSQTQNFKTSHVTYGAVCPLFCFDAGGKLIYRGSDPNLAPYFNP